MSFVRQYITIEGIVQGVGFRPYIYRLAREFHLSGHVINNGGVVEILAIGQSVDMNEFLRQIPLQAPPLSHIYRINAGALSPQPDMNEDSTFTILSSQTKSTATRFISPDLAICANCRLELFEHKNRRFRHMFNTCTDCGPRFSVTRALPYDRLNTTMDVFSMCASCETEYHSPTFRRFHAEPISCKECGPKIKFITARGDVDDESKQMSEIDLTYAVKSIREGRVIAIKGIGGYHFACSPMNAEAVKALRRLKGRETKPFAIMFSDLDLIRKYCEINPDEEASLTSPAAPITLLPMKSNPFPEEVLCGNNRMGCFLPYTPLHVLLLEQLDMLILTSANRSGSAILYKDDELIPIMKIISSDCSAATGSTVLHTGINTDAALSSAGSMSTYMKSPSCPLVQDFTQARTDSFWRRQLHGILTHNRTILRPLEDSVVQWNHNKMQYLRTGRGSSPTVFTLPAKESSEQKKYRAESKEFLALGGDLKAAFCVVKNGQAYLSQYFGDLEDETAMRHYTDEIRAYLTLFDVHPEFIICDKHPGYHSTKLALSFGLPVVQIQHHHAHGASVLAEYQLDTDAICICFDGTGYGDDHHIWGGEFFIYHHQTQEFERAAHLSYTELLGGDSSAKDAVKTALCFQYKALNHMKKEKDPQFKQNFKRTFTRDKVDINALSAIKSKCRGIADAYKVETHGLSNVDFECGGSEDMYMNSFYERADIVCAALAQHINTTESSSIGRLFDAVAALLFLSSANEYEGKCAQMLEQAAADAESMKIVPIDMDFHIYHTREGWILDEIPVIRRITACQDEIRSDPWMTRAAALGFHLAIAKAVYEICQNLSLTTGIRIAILSGGVFQNRLLTRALTKYLEEDSFQVYCNARSVPNDNGIALGQAYLGWMNAVADTSQ
jgi:hydrogenase maturation protein HypF